MNRQANAVCMLTAPEFDRVSKILIRAMHRGIERDPELCEALDIMLDAMKENPDFIERAGLAAGTGR